MEKEKKCGVANCKRKYYAKGHCFLHYSQVRRNGRVYSRTRYDKNKVIHRDNYCVLVLYSGYKEPVEVARVKIDKEDLAKVSEHKWCLHQKNKKCTRIVTHERGTNKLLLLHNIIFNSASGKIRVSFTNGDKLDFRKRNLTIK